MSRLNKVNPGQYTQAGRLSPDDAAREQRKTRSTAASERSGSGQLAGRASRNRATAAKKDTAPAPRPGSRAAAASRSGPGSR